MSINESDVLLTKKSAFISIIGRPNVGKSSLLNTLVGEKIAIVSKKPQTTRNRIMGVLTRDNTQLIFIDTPGFHKAKTKLGDYMVKSVKTTVSDVDVAVLVIDASREKVGNTEENLINSIKAANIPAIAVLNKIDLLEDKTKLMPLISELSQMYDFRAIIPISVKTGSGIELLLKEMEDSAIEGEYLFPEDTLTDQPEKVIAAETIREKILRFTDKEIPHGVFVSIEKMKKREDKPIVDIDAIVYCEKESHKSIIIGKNGVMLKKIGKMSRLDMEEFLGCKINLQLWVKTKEGWRNRENILRNFGYDLNLLK